MVVNENASLDFCRLHPEQQFEFEFNRSQSEAGYNQWQQERRAALEKLARKMGLPIGHRVEVWLQGGIRLRGWLRLEEERLWVENARDFKLRLVVDGVPFTAAEIESCVRQD
jgi:hypothetical protein